MVVPVERGREALLAGAKHLMTSGPAVTEMPTIAFITREGVNGQVLTQHVAAADDVTGFDGFVYVVPALVAMGAGLPGKTRDTQLH